MASGEKDFGPVFDRLKAVLAPYAPGMHVTDDNDEPEVTPVATTTTTVPSGATTKNT